jgi:hypothetical protein
MRQHSAVLWVALIVSTGVAGCIFGGGGKGKRDRAKQVPPGPPATLSAVDLSDAGRPVVREGGVELAAARNEWASFVLQVADRAPNATYSLRLNAPTLPDASAALSPGVFEVYQVLPMPVDVNRAGYARHTGQLTSRSDLPRALLPIQSSSGIIDITSLRDASRPTDPAAAAPPAEAGLLWVDVHVPPEAVAGQFAATVDVLSNGGVVASLPLKLTVYDFALPAERHLQVVGRLAWDDLVRLYPDRFEAVRPQLMNRNEARYADAIRTIDALLALAHRHRATAVLPALRPIVKWPPGAGPDVSWDDFDSLAAPWLSGQAFADGMPIGFWPLPAAENLDRYARRDQLQYWADAAAHFDQNDWLDRAPIWIEKVTPGRATEAEAVALSADAADTLSTHNRVRAVVPLEADQLHLAQGKLAAARAARGDAADVANEAGGAADVADAGDGGAADAGAGAADADPGAPAGAVAPGPERGAREIDPASTTRLWAAAPALVFAPPMRLWPEGADRPLHYLRTDQPALVPYVGAGGDERDVRLWAWLAYLRQARLIHWNAALPSLSDPTEAADPNEMIWFYPGEWFGLDAPVPTVQLKWLRRAQQDYEYLWFARDRADRAVDDGGRDVRINTLLMAQLITKPVEIQPGQDPDPTYALMSGTTNPAVWADAQGLLADMILLHAPDRPVDPQRQFEVSIRAKRWAEPQERPLLTGRTTEWYVDPAADADGDGAGAGVGPWLNLRYGVDVYNASAVTPADNLLAWTAAPVGWEIAPRPTAVPRLDTYKVHRAALEARFDLAKLTPAARGPMELTFTNGFNNNPTPLKVVVPVAASDRREGRIAIDGQLGDDWADADLVADGPLVRMLNRPGLQSHQLQPAAVPSRVYTSWAAGNFYVAFDLNGTDASGLSQSKNFVDYQFRRAWGEDLCELLIQPVTSGGAPGPTLHVVCKPNGSSWVERKAPGGATGPAAKVWQEIEANVRYTARRDGERWTGEVAIPWRAILDAQAQAGGGRGGDAEPPALLRFNFVQHRAATGESATWSGPVDFGRDDTLMGVLYLRDPEARRPAQRGMAGSSAEER